MKNLLIFSFVLALWFLPKSSHAQSYSDAYVIEIDASYDDYFSMEFADPEYNYIWMVFPGEVSQNDEKEQLSFTPHIAGSYQINTAYYLEEWDDVILGAEQFKIPKEYVGKKVVLQLR